MQTKGNGLVVITDRGGHLHDMLCLIEQLSLPPDAIITTVGPDVLHLKSNKNFASTKILSVPQSFSWYGKKRFWNPFLFLKLIGLSLYYALLLRPKNVVSTGASNVVYFCYFTKLLGSKIFHIENLAQVVNPSITGRLLYPIASGFFVQWEDLLSRYGKKAQYKGWVL